MGKRSGGATRSSIEGLADSDLLTLEEVAAYLRIDPSAAGRLCAKGALPFVRITRSPRIYVGDLRAFVHEHKVPRQCS